MVKIYKRVSLFPNSEHEGLAIPNSEHEGLAKPIFGSLTPNSKKPASIQLFDESRRAFIFDIEHAASDQDLHFPRVVFVRENCKMSFIGVCI